MKRTLVLALAILTLSSGELFAQQKTIVETAVAAGNFQTLVTAVKAAGLVDTLNGHKPFTVFAPTDEAFAHVDSQTLNSLLKPENKGQLAQVLTYHVLPGRIAAKDAIDLTATSTVNGQRLPLNFRGETLQVGNATVVVTDIQCSNGVIHVIDTVLMPALDSIPTTAKNAGTFDTLLAAVQAAGLADVLSGPGPFTVFAPTDGAFGDLPDGTLENLLKPENKQQLIDILKYHVVAGRVYDNDAVRAGRASTLLGRSVDIRFSAAGIRVNNAAVVARNIDTANGVVHVIDRVLMPTSLTRRDAMRSLSTAISKGVPVFNAGSHSDCCEIYMSALMKISETGIQQADDHTRAMIKQTIRNAKHTHDMTERAWVLRRGMDALYTRVNNMSDTMPPTTGR